MALSGKVDDCINAIIYYLSHAFTISNVSPNKEVPVVALNILQVVKVPGIGKLVNINNRIGRMVIEEVSDEVGTDETRSTGD
jgi:hypothetical protein